MKNILKRGFYDNEDIDITSNIYNDFKAYLKNVYFNNKPINDDIYVDNAESINFVLVNCYFKYFHPIYPIVNYKTFVSHVKNGTLSLHLLYAIYGMAYLMKPNGESYKANEFINKAKEIILQHHNNINIQLLQALALVSIYGNYLLFNL